MDKSTQQQMEIGTTPTNQPEIGEFQHDFLFKSISEGIFNLTGEKGIFLEGYCAVFKPRDRGAENFELDLSQESLSRKALEFYFRTNPVVLFEHGLDKRVGRRVIGKTVEYRIDNYGVWVRDFIPEPNPLLEPVLADVYMRIKNGFYRAFSIAGRWVKNLQNTIVELYDIVEHSVTGVPMQPHCHFTLAKSLELGAKGIGAKQVEEALQVVDAVKVGAVLSRANATKIQAAIALLNELLSCLQVATNATTELEIEVEVEPSDEMGMGAGGDYMTSAMKTKQIGEAEISSALNILQGALTMDPKNKGKEGGTETGAATTTTTDAGAGAITLTPDQYKTFLALEESHKRLEQQAEVDRIAAARLADEQKAQEEAAAAEKKRQDEVNAAVELKLKTMRVGQNFNHMAGAGNAPIHTPNLNLKTNTKDQGFSLVEFARHGWQNREYQYVEQCQQKGMYGQKTGMNETSGIDGAYLVPIEQSMEIVELLRAKAVIRQMPGVKIRTMMRDKLTRPRQISSSSAYWGGEMASMAANESKPQYGQIIFTAKKLYGIVRVTKEQLADADPNTEMLIREDAAAVLALKEDDGFLQGNGQNDTPLGILNSGITTIVYATGAVSAGPEKTNITKATAAIRNANAQPNGVIMHSRVTDYLSDVKDTSGQPVFSNVIGGFRWNDMQQVSAGPTGGNVLQVERGRLMGMTQLLSNQLAVSASTTGTSTVLFGDFTKFEIADRQDIEVEVDRSQGFFTDEILLKFTKRVDCAVLINDAFVRITGFPAIDIA